MSGQTEQYHPLLENDDEFISYDDKDLEQKYHRKRKLRHVNLQCYILNHLLTN